MIAERLTFIRRETPKFLICSAFLLAVWRMHTKKPPVTAFPDIYSASAASSRSARNRYNIPRKVNHMIDIFYPQYSSSHLLPKFILAIKSHVLVLRYRSPSLLHFLPYAHSSPLSVTYSSPATPLPIRRFHFHVAFPLLSRLKGLKLKCAL